jgi:hypothetical protein
MNDQEIEQKFRDGNMSLEFYSRLTTEPREDGVVYHEDYLKRKEFVQSQGVPANPPLTSSGSV